jgi:hypothetical protein
MSMQSNYLDFMREVNRYANEEVPRVALKFQKEVYYALLKGCVNKTPVKTGRAKANWVVTRGTFYAGHWLKKTDPDGSATIGKGWRVINKMSAYDDCYIQNNVPYADRLENGWSKQAPNGMMKVTMLELALKYGLEKMTHEDAANAIRQRFDQNVASVEELTVEYPNSPLAKAPSDSMWCRFAINWGDSNQVTLGAQKRHRTVGIDDQFKSSLRFRRATVTPLALGDRIKKLFRSVTVNGITWRTPSLASVGRDEQWWQTNVSCPFYFDDVDEV